MTPHYQPILKKRKIEQVDKEDEVIEKKAKKAKVKIKVEEEEVEDVEEQETSVKKKKKDKKKHVKEEPLSEEEPCTSTAVASAEKKKKKKKRKLMRTHGRNHSFKEFIIESPQGHIMLMIQSEMYPRYSVKIIDGRLDERKINH